MMTRKISLSLLCLALIAQVTAVSTYGQTTQAKPSQTDGGTPQNADRSTAYYHAGLAAMYTQEAFAEGHPELVTQAISEYKYALNADPGSPDLNNALAELYFRTGRYHDAEVTARTLLKTSPNDIQAHKILGRLYLRALGDGENSVSSNSPAGNALDQAIGEFEKIIALQPKSVEDHMILGQLYTVKHDAKKAEEQFKTAQNLEPESEEVVLNLARVYGEGNDLSHAAKVIEDVPAADRTPKMEFTLGAIYDQMKRSKDAIGAYQRANDLDPDNPRTLDALAQALLANEQYDEALKQYKGLLEADPSNIPAEIHISEILRRQGKFEEALTVIRKARTQDPNSLEAGYNEGLLLDVLGRFDEAAQTYEKMVDLTSHANGAYTTDEKNNRGIFLERLGALYHEMNKIDQAITAYQKLIDMGGDNSIRGYQGQVDTYRDAKQFDKAIAVSRKAVEANPKDRDLKLMLAGELADEGKVDEGLSLAKGLLNNTAEDRSVWLGIAQIDVRMKRWKDAEDALSKVEKYTSKKEDKIYLLFMRGELAERQKHYEPAEQYFRQLLDLDPNNAMALNYLGYMLGDKNMRLTEALKLVRKAVELDPINGAYLDSLGWIYFKMGEYETAEDYLRRAADRDRTDPTVHDHLGDVYEKTGRIRLAAEQWKISLAEYARAATADVEPGDVAKVQHKLDGAKVRLARQDSVVGQTKTE